MLSYKTDIVLIIFVGVYLYRRDIKHGSLETIMYPDLYEIKPMEWSSVIRTEVTERRFLPSFVR